MIPAEPDEQKDLHFIDRCLPAFDAQHSITIVEIEIDPALREIPLQKEGNRAGGLPVGYICFEYLYNFHNGILKNEDGPPLENIKDTRLHDTTLKVGVYVGQFKIAYA